MFFRGGRRESATLASLPVHCVLVSRFVEKFPVSIFRYASVVFEFGARLASLDDSMVLLGVHVQWFFFGQVDLLLLLRLLLHDRQALHVLYVAVGVCCVLAGAVGAGYHLDKAEDQLDVKWSEKKRSSVVLTM